MARRGHTAPETHLRKRKPTDRPSMKKAVAEAREHGDLAEDSEYHTAR